MPIIFDLKFAELIIKKRAFDVVNKGINYWQFHYFGPEPSDSRRSC
jgi:hypothetical protein